MVFGIKVITHIKTYTGTKDCELQVAPELAKQLMGKYSDLNLTIHRGGMPITPEDVPEIINPLLRHFIPVHAVNVKLEGPIEIDEHSSLGSDVTVSSTEQTLLYGALLRGKITVSNAIFSSVILSPDGECFVEPLSADQQKQTPKITGDESLPPPKYFITRHFPPAEIKNKISVKEQSVVRNSFIAGPVNISGQSEIINSYIDFIGVEGEIEIKHMVIKDAYIPPWFELEPEGNRFREKLNDLKQQQKKWVETIAQKNEQWALEQMNSRLQAMDEHDAFNLAVAITLLNSQGEDEYVKRVYPLFPKSPELIKWLARISLFSDVNEWFLPKIARIFG
ncbi:MAG: hypothetical protein WCT39_05210 [Candidatus Margulisiibacteriota bacterium]